MDNGWIKLHRKILENPICKKGDYLLLWITLLLLANHKENKMIWNNDIIVIKEGQFITGRKQLSQQTGISETTIERILKYLENGHQIGQQKTTKYRLITIVNWKDYQTSDTKADNKRTTNGQQTDTNKNDNNDKKEKNITETSSVDVNELIKTFESINPSCSKYYGNKTQRKACDSLISNYGFNRVKKVIEVTLPKTNTLPFFPSITTPVQLQEKWSSLESAIRKYQSKQHTEETKKGMALW